MEKKKYISPEMEIIRSESEDVIVTSLEDDETILTLPGGNNG